MYAFKCFLVLIIEADLNCIFSLANGSWIHCRVYSHVLLVIDDDNGPVFSLSLLVTIVAEDTMTPSYHGHPTG